MLFSDQRITESIVETLDRLQQRNDLPADVIYDLNVAATVLRHVQYVDISDAADVRIYSEEMSALLQSMQDDPVVAGTTGASVRGLLGTAITDAKAIAASPLKGSELKRAFLASIRCVDHTLGQIVQQNPELATPLFSAFTRQLLKLHSQLTLFASKNPDTPEQEQNIPGAEPLSLNALTEYARTQLNDPTAIVSDFQTLSGGFGKETSLFTVSSATLNADLVIRRDATVDAFGGLDCHTADKEYPVLKAVFSRGFTVPEPIWHETSSDIVPGPAFTIMRRAPGTVQGDATGGQSQVSGALQATLARVAARLHSLPVLPELAYLPTFSARLWQQSASDCTREYLSSWYDHYLKTSHLPIPAVHGLFNWLLTHVPDTHEPPGLVHGDIGFHNLLFCDDQVSAVLDWEFVHVGDPAEDLGYIRSVMGHQLDWPAFLSAYQQAGRPLPGEQRVRFYEIWAHVRNAVCSGLLCDHFETGHLRSIKYGLVVYRFVPHFIAQAHAAIARYESVID